MCHSHDFRKAIRAQILAESLLKSLLVEILNELNNINFAELNMFYNKALDVNLNE